MPVLYGVFLYMGVSSIKGIELCQRIACVFMPPKYQPDYMFLRHVPLRRVYFFTFIQVVCLALLWTIKAIKAVSIVFPLMVRYEKYYLLLKTVKRNSLHTNVQASKKCLMYMKLYILWKALYALKM